MKRMTAWAIPVLLASGSAQAALVDVEFISNGSFEAIPPCVGSACLGQGLMPAGWDNLTNVAIAASDTYSDNGSYGLDPRAAASAFRTNASSALDGLRFVAAFTAVDTDEGFGQRLGHSVVPGEIYSVSASLMRANGVGFPGGYDVHLGSDPGQDLRFLGSLGDSTIGDWVEFSFDFQATGDMAGLDYLQFTAIPGPPDPSNPAERAYIGMDALSMRGVADISTNWFVTLDGPDRVVLENDVEILREPASAPGPLPIEGIEGDDQLVLDFANGNPIPLEGLFFAGGDDPGSDGITLLGGTAGEVVYQHRNASDGTISVDSRVITYTGLEPISATINAASVTLQYSAAAETVTVSDAGAGQTQIASTAGETVTFNNPSSSLTIDTSAGDADTIDLNGFGPGFTANLVLDGDASDLVNVAGGGIGTVTTGGLTLLGGPQISFQIDGTTAGVTYDQLVVNGGVDLGLGVSALNLLLGFTPTIGDSFVLVDNDAADAVLGTFSGLSEGASFTLAGFGFGITYAGGDGNDVVLSVLRAGNGTPVPAPATLALAALGLVAAARRRRVRR